MINFVSFALFLTIRGAEYSRSSLEILNECKNLVSNGAREITLIGQNVNAYNYENKKLSDLIKEISTIENLKRIRYTTSHPRDFTNDLIEAHGEVKNLMPLIHLPVQTGSNKILKLMNRKHTIEEYLNIIEKLRKINPTIKFSSDFIIGYPGESEDDFNETINLLKEVQFINCYSFIYSPRPGTPAASMKKVDINIAKERLNVFQKSAENIKLNFRKDLLNKNSLVLFENNINGKREFFGKDEFSNSVIVKSDKNIKGKIENVKIVGGNQNSYTEK